MHTLPKEVSVGYLNVKIKLYIQNPLHCGNCLQLSHLKNTFKSKTSGDVQEVEHMWASKPHCIN